MSRAGIAAAAAATVGGAFIVRRLLLQQRDHEDFVVRLRELVPDKQQLLEDLQANAARHFALQVRCCPAATAASPAI